MACDEVSNFGSISNFLKFSLRRCGLKVLLSLLGDNKNELGNMLTNFDG